MRHFCVNCKCEETCGYSPLAMLGYRTKNSYVSCCLGKMSYRKGTFFEPKDNKEKEDGF